MDERRADDIAFDVPASVFVEPGGDDRYQPIELPIARELLQAERERLARDHYPTDAFTCRDCDRLAAVIAELREIG